MTRSADVALALLDLRSALAGREDHAGFFALVAAPDPRRQFATRVSWRDYFLREQGTLAQVVDDKELIMLVRELLKELKKLRAESCQLIAAPKAKGAAA